METEINLIKAMVDVLIYEQTISPNPNELVIKAAHEIMGNKVIEIAKVLKNPGKFDIKDDLIQ